MKKINTFLIVCYANFCRSPVAEQILNHRYKGDANFNSAGIRPFPEAAMDKRSYDYLISQNIKTVVHNPKKLKQEMSNEVDYILAMDNQILLTLNKLLPKHRNKIALFNKGLPHLTVFDPYKLNDEEYSEAMKRISSICNNFDKNFPISC